MRIGVSFVMAGTVCFIAACSAQPTKVLRVVEHTEEVSTLFNAAAGGCAVYESDEEIKNINFVYEGKTCTVNYNHNQIEE